MQFRFQSHLNSAARICTSYTGFVPLAVHLKTYFSANKKYGSRDRKQISHLCFCFFRLGKLVLNTTTEEKMMVALFLCSVTSNEVLKKLKPEWNEKVEFSLEQKLAFLNLQNSVEEIFPWRHLLSDTTDYQKYIRSFLTQPDLFIRVRPSYLEKVIDKLTLLKAPFEFIAPNAIRLPNSFKVEEYFILDKEVVIQDFNSQQIGEFIQEGFSSIKSEINFWDCCAGSGGKSIMAFDIKSNIHITVSDIRKTIQTNLRKRFQQAGIQRYNSVVADVANSKKEDPKYNFILADVPCTGSGTWSRTPEQVYFFNEKEVEKYASLQRKIVSNAAAQLRSGGFMLYCTCSVFQEENEQIVEYIKNSLSLKLVKMELLKGYEQKSDTMFSALFSS